MKLKERRQKINKALDTIVEMFKEIEITLTPFQKKWGVRCLVGVKDFENPLDNHLRYIPIPTYEKIHTKYRDKEGNIFEIDISYYQKRSKK